MRNDVSLWLGSFSHSKYFEEYTEIKYDEDGDSIDSIFESEFNLGYYDRDFTEKGWIPASKKDINYLLADFSYADQLITQFLDVQLNSEYNSILLVYNYNYNHNARTVKSVINRSYKVDFIGTAEYID